MLEDYAPALGVGGGLLVGKRCKKYGKIIITKKLTGKINMKKKEENKHKKKKPIIMWGLVMLVHAWGSSKRGTTWLYNSQLCLLIIKQYYYGVDVTNPIVQC